MQYNGQTLAYLGDAVYELLVRNYLLKNGITQSVSLHQEAVKWTSAKGQFQKLKIIEESLTDEEHAVLKRGRNTKLTRKARNTDIATYHYATGLEALFGYLHLSDQQKRIDTLFKAMTAEDC